MDRLNEEAARQQKEYQEHLMASAALTERGAELLRCEQQNVDRAGTLIDRWEVLTVRFEQLLDAWESRSGLERGDNSPGGTESERDRP